MSEKKQEEEFHFLQESPLNSEQSVEFGHRNIIATLTRIICHTGHNMTIGLFGSWGTGKSTIVEVLKADLKIKQIPVVIFDVWKHEGDALRRTFLRELDEQLSNEEYGKDYLHQLNVLDERVYVSENAASETYKFLTGKIWRHMAMLAIISVLTIFALFLVRGFILLFWDADIFNKTTIPAAGSLFASVLAGGLLFKYLDSFIKTEKRDIKKDKFQDPHEFATEFGKLISNLRSDKKKIVITFDNLDRISGDNALKVIATIKTFLDFRVDGNKIVFFLIPCDVMAMKSHILAPLGNYTGDDKNMYVEEFLRKFFNTGLWIPEFYDTELENFASIKLAETGIAAFCDDYLAWLILKAFNQNPRQIIQFINQLLANYLLLKEVCDNNGLSDKSFYKNNVPQLAKFLLLKQKFPEQIERYRNTNTYFLSDTAVLQGTQNDAFDLFIRQTADIHIASLEPFFRYKTSRHEQKIPGINKLFSMLAAEDEGAKDYAAELKLISYQDDFNSLLKTYMKPISNPVIKVKFINSVLRLAADIDFQLSASIKRDIINTLVDSNMGNLMHMIGPEFVTSQLMKSDRVTQAEKNSIVINYFTRLTGEELTKSNSTVSFMPREPDEEILAFFRDNDALLSSEFKTKFDTYLVDNFTKLAVRDIFVKDQETQKKFISHAFRKKAIDAMADPAFRRADSMYIILDLLDSFEPKSLYVDFILHIFNTNAAELFNMKSISNRPGMLDLLAVLSRNLNADQIKNANTRYFPTEEDRKLFKGKATNVHYDVSETKILDHIFKLFNNIEADMIPDFTSFLKVVYLHESGAARVETIINRLISQQPIRGIELVRQEPFDLNKVIFQDTNRLSDFITQFLLFPGVRELTEASMNAGSFVELIINRINVGHYKIADQYLHSHRNEFIATDLDRIEKHLLNSLKNYKSEHGRDLKVLLGMIRFVRDNDLSKLSFVDYWTPIVDLLLHQDSAVQEMGYQLYKENLELFEKSIAGELSEYLVTILTRQEHKNHYYAHEVVAENKKHLSNLSLNLFLDYLYADVFRSESSENILEACIPFIADLNYDIIDYEEDIKVICFHAEQVKPIPARFEKYQKILQAMQKRLKKASKSPPKAYLTSLITDTLK